MVFDHHHNFKIFFSFFFREKLNLESFRFTEKIDTNISDKITKKNKFSYKYWVNSFTKNQTKGMGIKGLKNKSALIKLITSFEKGVSVKLLLRSYPNIKNDLLDIVKYRERNRILILIKGKDSGELLIFPFHAKFWIKICNKLILQWHKV
jgi:hypothetical protein